MNDGPGHGRVLKAVAAVLLIALGIALFSQGQALYS
jgi:hypothetical protein